MNMLVSGASGLIGSSLIASLSPSDRVMRLTRHPKTANQIAWDPLADRLDPASLGGCNAVVHLAGEPVFGPRWTAKKKSRIRESRVRGTDLLCRALAAARERPSVMICASAIGFYGDRGNQVLDETSSAGSGFLAEVCQAWEAATAPAVEAGIRVVNFRFGIVLSPAGGALRQMLIPFRLGLGGRLGSGMQYVSWIALPDVVGAILHAISTPSLSGPVNIVAPNPVTNIELTGTLGAVLGRPTLLPTPAVAIRLALGEMCDAVLASARVIPRKLQQSGYHFQDAQLADALRRLLADGNAPPRKSD